MPTQEEVLEVLRTVEDPELGMDIVDLGLLYEVEVADSTAKVTYSLTSMGCPAGPLIAQDIDSAIRQVEGIEDVELELTFDPPWTPDRMSDDAKFILGFGCRAVASRLVRREDGAPGERADAEVASTPQQIAPEAVAGVERAAERAS